MAISSHTLPLIKYLFPSVFAFTNVNFISLQILSTKIVNQKHIELVTADNGKGIDLKRNKEMLFGLYQRFDQTVEGRGLGLYMVKNQVEALDGTIEVDSVLGEGTSFTIRLPN